MVISNLKNYEDSTHGVSSITEEISSKVTMDGQRIMELSSHPFYHQFQKLRPRSHIFGETLFNDDGRLLEAGKYRHTREIALISTFFVILLAVLFYFRRKLLLPWKRRGNGNRWGSEEDFATTIAEYDELLQDTFNDDEFTQDDSDESITSILSEWSEGASEMHIEMNSITDAKR